MYLELYNSNSIEKYYEYDENGKLIDILPGDEFIIKCPFCEGKSEFVCWESTYSTIGVMV